MPNKFRKCIHSNGLAIETALVRQNLSKDVQWTRDETYIELMSVPILLQAPAPLATGKLLCFSAK